MYNLKKYSSCFLFFVAAGVYAQYQSTFVAHSNSFDATAYNNSHKIVSMNGDLWSDTIYIVYHSSDTVYHTYTTDMGQSWQTPVAVHIGAYPALDLDSFGLRHVAWQYFDSGTNNYEIYYDCLDDWCPPMNISQSTYNSTLPDLVIDSYGVVHIVWVEELSGYDQIFYRPIFQGILGDTTRLSDFGSNEATYTHPSISIFQPANRVYSIWQCYDSLCYSPYQIHLRYRENDIWSQTTTWAHYLTIQHPSLDLSRGQDTLSFCYEDSTSGNMEASFYGGNGGGFPTPGRSTYPVISTVGPVWSYLFWQEDSAGHEDIYCHLYYEFAGWINHSLRGIFNIQEPVRYPSTCGAYLVWTQGDSAPYSIYFADFGYPIGIHEFDSEHFTQVSANPNPFSQMINIRYRIANPECLGSDRSLGLKIFNAAGQLVKNFSRRSAAINPQSSIRWYGDDNLGYAVPAGVYFCYCGNNTEDFLIKIVKVE